MKRKSIVIAAALAATVGAAALAFNSSSYAQGWGYMGPGMMGGNWQGNGSGQGYGMMNSYGPGWMHSQGYGPGWMHSRGYGSSQGYGPGWMHGGRGYGPCWDNEANAGQQRDLKLTTDDVKTRMERWVGLQRNPRLKLGDVKEKDADTITADIVTVDNSLVQRFAINRHTGAYSPEEGK
jgi:hypothetical protein